MAKSLEDLKIEIKALKAEIGSESSEVKTAILGLQAGTESLKMLISQLQAQILQAQTDASVPLDVSALYEELVTLKADVDAIYVEAAVAPIEVPVEVIAPSEPTESV